MRTGYAQQMERVGAAYDALVWQSTGEDLGVGFGENPEEGLEENASDRPPSPTSPAGHAESRAQHLAAARRRARWQAARPATRAVTDAAGVFNRLSRRSSVESAAGRSSGRRSQASASGRRSQDASGRRSQEELPPRRSSGPGAQQGWRWRWE